MTLPPVPTHSDVDPQRDAGPTNPADGPASTASTAPEQSDPTAAGPTGPQTGAPPSRPAPRRRAGVGAVVAASLLSAALASGGTYVAIRAADDAPAVTTQAADQSQTGATTVSLTGEQDWASIAQAVSPSVVSISVAGQLGSGAGSGVIWDTEGHIVTNAHVVEGANQVAVTLADGRAYSAQVVGSDPSSDLAVLTLDTVPDNLTPIRVGDDGALGVGDPVMAVGNPLGLSGTVTTGIVSALDRPVTTQGSAEPGTPAAQVVTNAIQTSAAINPGNSGGALVNAAGELVGINSSIATLSSGMSNQGGSIGIGFAIPSVKVSLIAEQLIETGTATHAFLGVGLADGATESEGANLSGALVRQVEASSPAAEAGLQEGDLIIAIDGERVTSSTALIGQVRERGTGQETTIEYVRGGERAEVTVELATRPDEN